MGKPILLTLRIKIASRTLKSKCYRLGNELNHLRCCYFGIVTIYKLVAIYNLET